MSRLVFTLWDGGGNVAPVLSVAGAMSRRGHDVRVLADRVLREDVLAAGARHLPWTKAPQRSGRGVDTEFVRDFEARTPTGAMALLRDRLMIGAASEFADDTLAELEREPADAVVSEMLLIGSILAAEAAPVPSILLVPNVYPGEVQGQPPFGAGLRPMPGPVGRLRDRVFAGMGRRLWDKRLDDLNALRGRHGLAPVTTIFEMLESPARALVLTSAAFELGGGAGVPGNVRYCGPRLDDPAWAGAWTEPPGTDPLVLVSLSTTYQKQGPVVARIVDALGRLPVRGLITTGPSIDPAAIATPANVTVVASAPHSAVLPRAAAVVTHAGHGTVIKALAHGVPLVCMPVGRDQPDTAARVVAAGAGVKLRPSARTASIERALTEVLGEPTYREAAARIEAAIAADRRRDLAAEELEAALGEPVAV